MTKRIIEFARGSDLVAFEAVGLTNVSLVDNVCTGYNLSLVLCEIRIENLGVPRKGNLPVGTHCRCF